MMSQAFKVFLLMVLGFGSLWAYQYRTRDLRAWLERGEPALGSNDELAALRSPVDRFLDPRKDSRALATIYFQEPLRAPEVQEEEEVVMSDRATPAPTPPAPAPTPPAARPAAPPRRHDPEEEPPVALIFRDTAPREAVKKEKEREKEKEKEKEKAKASVKSAEKTPEKKTERPKIERPKPSGQDPHAMPADGSRPPGEATQGLAGGPAAVEAPAARRRTITHVVKEKETLASLARQYYQSDTGRWREIFAANQGRLPDPDALSPGMVIEIPDAAPAEAPGKGAKKPAAAAAAKPKPKPSTRSG